MGPAPLHRRRRRQRPLSAHGPGHGAPRRSGWPTVGRQLFVLRRFSQRAQADQRMRLHRGRPLAAASEQRRCYGHGSSPSGSPAGKGSAAGSPMATWRRRTEIALRLASRTRCRAVVDERSVSFVPLDASSRPAVRIQPQAGSTVAKDRLQKRRVMTRPAHVPWPCERTFFDSGRKRGHHGDVGVCLGGGLMLGIIARTSGFHH
jgi:hypothetical protein